MEARMVVQRLLLASYSSARQDRRFDEISESYSLNAQDQLLASSGKPVA